MTGTVTIGVSLKSYLGPERTRAWLAEVASTPVPEGVELVLFPEAIMLADAVRAVEGTGIAIGAQDLGAESAGAHTGQIPGAHLRELGVRYAEVGHAERRASGDGEPVIRAKAAAAQAAGLVPWLCVASAKEAFDVDGVVAYEPIASIGAERPAHPDAIAAEVAGIRRRLRPGTPIVYGGSAGPGTWAGVAGIVDGLFLGRFAHEPAALATVIREAAARYERTRA